MVNTYKLLDDGTYEIHDYSYSDLKPTGVFIIVDIDGKRLHIWKGNEAPVRQKFISARVAQDIRLKEYGMAFKVESQDQGEESESFLSMFGVSGSSAGSSQASGPVVTAAPAGTQPIAASASPQPVAAARPASAAPQPVSASPRPASATTQPVAAARPASQPTPSPQPVASARTPPPRSDRVEPVHHAQDFEVTKSTSSVAPPSQDLVDKTIEKLKELDEPEGMQREIVIIGQSVFSAHKEYHKLFKKEVVKLDPMDDLPPGAFPANDYYARLFIENGKVIFIELFTETPASAREEFLADMRSSLRDLTKLGI